MQVNAVSNTIFSSSWTSQYMQAGRESLGKVTKSDWYQPLSREPLTPQESGLAIVKASQGSFGYNPSNDWYQPLSGEPLTPQESGLAIVKGSQGSVAAYSSQRIVDKGSVSKCLREKNYI